MILIVDDDRAVLMALKMLLTRAGYEVTAASSPEEALPFVRAGRPRLIITDMNFSRETSGEEGLHFLRQIRIFMPDVPVILITAWGSIDLAVEGMRRGAFDFITKPWNNRLMLQRVETALNLAPGQSHERQKTGNKDGKGFDRTGIIGSNAGLEKVLAKVERVAPTAAPVLILGENGSGKELIAEAIHRNSPRRDRPFVKVNLGGMSSSLFESEMFGHVKGAFTGAVAARKGRFELADGGTIFLDEIGDLDLQSQVKLLRVLQEHTFEPLGDSRSRRVDIRVVCATNANLERMVAEGTFREDLYYRINLISLRLPSLRERRDDIPALARHFARRAAEEASMLAPDFTASALRQLSQLSYPGNIRQLSNIVRRAVILADGPEIDVDGLHLSDYDLRSHGEEDHSGGEERDADSMTNAGSTLSDIEQRAINDALSRHDGNLSRAAASLGITRQSLYRRMEKFGIQP